ncbi:MAG TPA: NAD(P)H-dependent oxidoreductase [Caulobacteraceae bacterium]|jgi:NAD(P)H dehydrogenase (quinone)
MKHAVILAHPNADSFNATVAKTYCDLVRRRGHEPILRDLYRMGFDPLMQAGEIPGAAGFGPAPDIVAEREVIGDADVFVFVYPLWFYAPPAMLKGYIDRVFGMGFGFGAIQGGGNTPLLQGRKMISFTSTGSPMVWVEQEGAWAAIRNLFDSHLAQVCGLTVLDHVHFGGIGPGMRPDAVEDRMATVREAALRLF